MRVQIARVSRDEIFREWHFIIARALAMSPYPFGQKFNFAMCQQHFHFFLLMRSVRPANVNYREYYLQSRTFRRPARKSFVEWSRLAHAEKHITAAAAVAVNSGLCAMLGSESSIQNTKIHP